ALLGAGPKAEQEKYITFANGRIYIVTAKTPTLPPLRTKAETDRRQAEQIQNAVSLFRRLVAETELEVPGINVGVTGEPVLEYDEMRQSQRDSTFATIVSLVLASLIFIIGYREVGRPLKAVVSLIVGLGYTMGYTTLVVGHLN